MKKTLALVLTLAIMLTMFMGVQAFAFELPKDIGANDITVTGICAGSTQVIGTFVAGLKGQNVVAYLHEGADNWNVLLGFSGTFYIYSAGGTFTINLSRPLVEGEIVRLSIGTSNVFTPWVITVPAAPVPDPIPGDSLEGEGDITITPPDYKVYLLNPTSSAAKTLAWDTTDAVTLGGLAFNFGSYQLKAEPQTAYSNNSVSMIHGHEAMLGYNAPFQVTATITDFVTSAGVSIFSDFSLKMARQNEYFELGALATRRVASKRPATIDLSANEPEVIVIDDVIGHSLTNYAGTLNYTSSATGGVGTASAKLIWEIAPYVEF